MGQTKQQTPEQKAQQNFRELLHKFDTAMLVTHGGSGGPLHARPMAVAEVSEDGSIWFITNINSPKISEIKQDSEITAAFQESRLYLSVTGRGELDRDRAHIDKVWKDSYKVWFEKGKDDPSIVLIRLRPSEAEYWDNTGTQGLRFALEYATAFVQGREMKGPNDVDQHAKVRA